MPKTILISGASSGIGELSARALADAGHTVFAGMRGTSDHNAKAVAAAADYAKKNNVDLRSVELDVGDQASVDAGVAQVLGEVDKLDVVIHNAGHMVLGPVEAFTPEQLHEIFDVNAVSTQRLNRAVLPHLREQRDGYMIWIGSSSTRGGTPPYLAPYFAAKAAEDSLAASYSVELTRFGIETTIVVPGSFTTGTHHFANAGHPADSDIEAEYEVRYPKLMDQVSQKLAALSPPDADPAEVASAVVRIVDMPKGARPFRVHVDPADDGAETMDRVGDLVRTTFYERIDLEDLLHPSGA